MSDNCLAPEALYVGLCVYIGTPIEVTVRREVMDTDELLKIFLEELEHSGSRLMCIYTTILK